ncbi:hypothetical protein KAFR_0A03640 [Kazachstania africana CBS 2517]|uniref:Translocon Sec61/SecY plug domain-containing protein n=1 Tax=Kazachstania africana (strain ATCC 22294 / BCRC 22015 / CBS 2517 / CECT 1963 / NBRC 1671 / NRRL Y-8276) TaxID=1071382 RepID=H2AN49_KAZAF|nr:hypothetical protein KAFR_0A03640 [Kazachstania africana CBS 2517]CCF55799.1 hypothetical protein KAFR_0A03640 [Kazachstania africana CBS 2517]
MAKFSYFITVRLIDVVKPFLPILPEVELPYEKIEFDDRVVYTIFSGLIYLFAQFPLAGIPKDLESNVKDPIYFLRGVFAAEPKTILEFGIFPVIASPLLLQLMAGLRIIKVNFKIQQDRELFQSLTKLFAIFQYIILSNVFIFSGYYGDSLTIAQIFLLNIQLVGAGIFVTLMCEVVDKGFGFTSGAMVINTAVIATNLVADTFGISQITIDTEGHQEPQGSLINLLQGVRAKHKTFVGAIVNAFNRDYLPNLTTTCVVVAIAMAIGYIQNIRIEVPVRSTRARGMNNVYPIRLLHVGSLSVLFSYVCLFYIHILGFILIQLIGKNNADSLICKVLGHYEIVNNILYVPTFPLSSLAPPKSLFGGILEQPISFIAYPLFIVITGIWFACNWQAISGQSARDIAKDFKDQGITLTGRREQNISKELNKIVPVASTTGAAILAAITVLGELLGLKGKAAGMVIGIAGGYSILEIVTLDYQQNGSGSNLGQVLSGQFAL